MEVGFCGLGDCKFRLKDSGFRVSGFQGCGEGAKVVRLEGCRRGRHLVWKARSKADLLEEAGQVWT